MIKSLAWLVRRRAKGACEYCRMPEVVYDVSFPIDHVVARQHGGQTVETNLALACVRCNGHKGPNLAGIDLATGQAVLLFHPRRDRWADHFEWRGPLIIGLTPRGRATVHVLAMNGGNAVAIREALIAEGHFPPDPVGG